MVLFGLVMEYDKLEIFHFSKIHNNSNSELDLSAIGAHNFKLKTYWRYLGFYFYQYLFFKKHVYYYSTKVKAIIMLRNSTRGFLLLYK